MPLKPDPPVLEALLKSWDRAWRAVGAAGTGADLRERLLVDVDLSILGAAPSRFDEYERQVRQEYAWVPGWLFRRKRRALLQALLARARIYGTAHFRDGLEIRARENLRRSQRPHRSMIYATSP